MATEITAFSQHIQNKPIARLNHESSPLCVAYGNNESWWIKADLRNPKGEESSMDIVPIRGYQTERTDNPSDSLFCAIDATMGLLVER
jgi:hypothetical protein